MADLAQRNVSRWSQLLLAAILVGLVGGAFWLKTRAKPTVSQVASEPTETLLARGISRHTARQDDAVLEVSRQILKDSPRHPLALFNLGVTLLESGRADEAIRWLTAARREDPTRADTHYYLGMALLRQRRLDEARESLRKALDLEPRHAGAHIALAKVYLARGERDLAREAFANAAKLNPYSKQ